MFQPGQSGNPAGRPKRKTLTEQLWEVLDEAVNGNPQIKRAAEAMGIDVKTKAGARIRDLVILATLLHGVKGNASILKEVWDRSDGRPRGADEELEMGDEAAGPKVIRSPLPGPSGPNGNGKNGQEQ